MKLVSLSKRITEKSLTSFWWKGDHISINFELVFDAGKPYRSHIKENALKPRREACCSITPVFEDHR
jgi:hypothetical protein